jgi:hypothetical protein
MLTLIFIAFVISKNVEIPTIDFSAFQNIEQSSVCSHNDNIPNLDTLTEYILTQSKTNMDDVNAIAQVMLRRFKASKYKTISEMLYSNSSLGSSTIKKGGGRYWFTEKSLKYRGKVRSEVMKVVNGERLVPCFEARYFSNHACTYHSNNPKYQIVYQTSKHKFFVKA